MKRIHLYTAGLALTMLTYACTDEEMTQSGRQLRITGGMPTESRTVFVDDGNVTHTQWVVDDEIGLFTDSQSNLSYKATNSGSTTEFAQSGTYALDQEEGSTVYAYYPHTSMVVNENVRLPNTSWLTDGSSPVFLYSEATINGNSLNFTFKHLYAYLRITVTSQEFIENFPSTNDCTYTNCGIYLSSSEYISTNNSCYFNLKTKSLDVEHGSYIVNYTHKGEDVSQDGSYTYLIPILPQSPSADIMIYLSYEGKNSFLAIGHLSKSLPEGGFQAGHIYNLSTSGDVLPDDSQLAALTTFYQSTGGDQWTDNTNWLSNRPLEEWYGVNAGGVKFSYVNSLYLSNNNLTGQLPEVLAVLMDKASYIHIGENYLSGDIPQVIKEHPQWNKHGWNIVSQDVRNGGGLNLENSNLYIENETVTDVTTSSQASLLDIFKKNTLTQVITTRGSTSDVIMSFDAARVNRFLDFQSKGLGTVIFTGAETGSEYETEIRTLIQEKYASVEGVNWLYGNVFLQSYHTCYSYIFDSNGQLMHISQYEIGNDNTAIAETEYAFFQSHLGEPDTSHPQFTMNYYTSSDYSQDGEIFTIQTSTVGNGIDLVFMGEGFTDKDMAAGGSYEQVMQEAVEKLFSIEPYSSLRDRFNVYGIKVVSPNAEFADDATRRINEDGSVAFEYARKVIGENAERAMVTVVYNTDEYVDRSYCRLYSDGSFVAYVMDAFENTLIHEVGGHGIAKLADEYVEPGYESLSLIQGEIESLNYWKEYGWFLNVDYNNTPETVNWAHLLADTRFDNEDLDIYEGAFHYGFGAYRPSDDSMMRHNIDWFNAPSRELIYKAAMTLSEGGSWTYNYEDFVSFDAAFRASSSRSVIPQPTVAEKREIQSRHRPPIYKSCTWRDALKQGKRSITVPLR